MLARGKIFNSLKTKTILLLATSVVWPMAFASAVHAITVQWNPVGAYVINYTCTATCSGSFDFSMNITGYNQVTGAITGNGTYLADPSFTWDLSGNLDGSTLSPFNVVFTGGNPGLAVNGSGSIDSGGNLSGTAASIFGTYAWHTTSGAATPANILSSLSPAQAWISFKDSDYVCTKFDIKAEVLKNGSTLVGSGELDGVSGASAIFNQTLKRLIPLTVIGSPSINAGDSLSLKLSARISTSTPFWCLNKGTASLWYNDGKYNSSFGATIGGSSKNYYLRAGNALATSPGSGPTKISDVSLNKWVGGNPFKPFGIWTTTF